MATPTSPLSFGNIYSEANGGTPGGATSWGNLSRNSYFEGPNGNNSISFNAWGAYGNSLGANVIYNVQVDSTPNFGSYRGKDYFYGAAPGFDTTLYVANNANADCFDCQLFFYDNSLTYSYMQGNSAVVPQLGGTYGPATLQGLQPSITPLINTIYWVLNIDMDPGFGGGTVDYFINSSLKIVGAPLNPGFNQFDYNAYGTEDLRTSIGFTGSIHEVYIN